jgi:hypothetical protein
MRWTKTQTEEALTAREAFEKLTLDDLRPLAGLVSADPPKRKTEVAPLLAGVMADASRVRELYSRLDPVSQHAVRVAAFDPAGRLDRNKFRAWFGEEPRFNDADPARESWSHSYSDRRKIQPTLLRLFFPRFDHLPTDTRTLLREFIPPPEPFAVPTRDAPPETHTLHEHTWHDRKRERREWEEPVRVRETAGAAGADVLAVLRLIEAGKVRVTDKKLVPTEAARQAVAGVLTGGDFYAPDDAAESKWDPSFDLKGQGKARMSAAAGRRAVLVEGLAACPVGRWLAVDDFFRLLRATGRSFALAHSIDELYIAEHHYGNLGYDDEHAWEQLQGRFALAFLFESAATLGSVDVAYVPPQGVRHDFHGRWGADEFTCLSRYDGLLFLRVNPLGAWLLGLADEYRPAAPRRVEVFRLLANLDVVAARDLPASDRLVLERFAAPASEGVWKLSAAKALGVIEQGGRVDELEQFLALRTTGELPGTVVAFLADLRAKAGRLTDAGAARLIRCADEHAAAELAADRRLKGKCLRAGDRFVVVREADLDAVRKVARKLGYVWPIPGD